MKEELIKLFKIDVADKSDEQIEALILERANAVVQENAEYKRIKFLGHNLTEEQQASVLRRKAAGLSLEDAVQVELAQAKHDALMGLEVK